MPVLKPCFKQHASIFTKAIKQRKEGIKLMHVVNIAEQICPALDRVGKISA